MINKSQRNEEKLIDFQYIYVVRQRNLDSIVSEAGINLKTEKCKLCEGGGWYSNGTRYFYKDMICEF